MLGMKRDALAAVLGDDWTQLKISRLEAKEEIEPALLDEVAKALKIPVEAIKNFDEDAAINIISNTFSDGSFLNTGNSPTFNVNPIEKLVQLHEEKIALYERMLKEKDEMMARLEQLINKK